MQKQGDELLQRPAFAAKPDVLDLGLYGVSSTDEDEVPGGLEALKMRRSRMETLMTTMNELNKAMESFVGAVVAEPAPRAAELDSADE